MGLEDLPAELREMAQAAKTPEELLALAEKVGYELSDEELASVSGGWDPFECGEYVPGGGPDVY